MTSLENYKNVFVNRLKKLKNSQASIQSLSLWVLYHHKIGKMLVQTWRDYFLETDSSRFILLVYLANDVLQNGKKKTSTFTDTFATVLPQVMPKIMSSLDEKSRGKIFRVFDLWVERDVFKKQFIQQIKNTPVRRRSPVQMPNSPKSPPRPQKIIPPPPRIEHAIVDALVDLDKIKKEGESTGFGMEKYEQQKLRFSSLLGVDQLDISQMDINELKSLRDEYTKNLRDIDSIRTHYRKEAMSRTKLCNHLSNELTQQQAIIETSRPAQKFWNEGFGKVDEFLSRLDLSIKAKAIDEQNDFSFVDDDNFLSSTSTLNKKRKISEISGGAKPNQHTATKKRKIDHPKLDQRKNSKRKKKKEEVDIPKDLLEDVDVGEDLEGFLSGFDGDKK